MNMSALSSKESSVSVSAATHSVNDGSKDASVLASLAAKNVNVGLVSSAVKNENDGVKESSVSAQRTMLQVCDCVTSQSVKRVSKKFYAELLERVRVMVNEVGFGCDVYVSSKMMIDKYIANGGMPDRGILFSLRIIFALLKPEIDKAINRSRAAKERAEARRRSAKENDGTVGRSRAAKKRVAVDRVSEMSEVCSGANDERTLISKGLNINSESKVNSDSTVLVHFDDTVAHSDDAIIHSDDTMAHSGNPVINSVNPGDPVVNIDAEVEEKIAESSKKTCEVADEGPIVRPSETECLPIELQRPGWRPISRRERRDLQRRIRLAKKRGLLSGQIGA